MRQLIPFDCSGAGLIGTLDDDADALSGLLIVSGGNEIRIGAHRGQARLAQRVAEAGFAVFRFDRRGVGDSEGENGGFLTSRDDMAAALDAFRRAKPSIRRIVAFGNCDAATALALFHATLPIDGLVLGNPWVVEPVDDLPPPAAIRARYRERLSRPSEWLRLLRGGVDLRKVVKGLRASAVKTSSPLAEQMRLALAASTVPIDVVLAERDATAIAFREQWQGPDWRHIRESAVETSIDSASHSFASAGDADALLAVLLAALRR